MLLLEDLEEEESNRSRGGEEPVEEKEEVRLYCVWRNSDGLSERGDFRSGD